MENSKEEQIVQLSRKQIYRNSIVLSNALYGLCKERSQTDFEFNIKYEVYDKLMRTYNRWGYGGQATAFGGLVFYCMKGKRAAVKLGLGFLYVYWINHFFNLSSQLGVTVHLPWALEKVTVGEQYQMGRHIQYLIKLINQREDQIQQKYDIVYTDGQIQELFNKQLSGNNLKQVNLQDGFKVSRVQNSYFEQNKSLYFKENQSQEELLKLPFLDCFLTRYIYHSFARWGNRVGQWLGVIGE